MASAAAPPGPSFRWACARYTRGGTYGELALPTTESGLRRL